MKTWLQRCSLIGIILSLFSSACNENQPGTGSGKFQLALTSQEDTVDLQPNPVTKKTGDSLRKIFRDSILLNNTVHLSDTAEIIAVEAFAKLVNLSSTLQGSSTTSYIRCIGITYGLNPSGNKIKLFYKPFLLKKTSAPSVKTMAEYAPVEGTTYYEYSLSGDTFAPVANADVKAALKTYTANITYRDPASPAKYRRYRASNDSTGDVKVVLYSFQEIDSICTAHSAREIYFLNMGEIFRANHTNYLKHNILIGSDNINVHKELFYGKYGNLSHLCPPSCSTVKVNLIK